jgi:hypothetical protein
MGLEHHVNIKGISTFAIGIAIAKNLETTIKNTARF